MIKIPLTTLYSCVFTNKYKYFIAVETVDILMAT